MCLFLQLPVLICFREGQIFTPSQNNSLFFSEQLLLGGINTGKKKKKKQKKLLDQKSGDGENLPPTPLYHPLGQDQAEKLYGAHHRDMDAETCYRPPDRLLIVSSKPHRTRKKTKTAAVPHLHPTQDLLYLWLCHICGSACTHEQGVGEWQIQMESGKGPEKAAVSVGTAGSQHQG